MMSDDTVRATEKCSCIGFNKVQISVHCTNDFVNLDWMHKWDANFERKSVTVGKAH